MSMDWVRKGKMVAVIICMLCIVCYAGTAGAISINWNGSVIFANSNGTGLTETVFFTPGAVSSWDPLSDTFFSTFPEIVIQTPLTLSESSYVSGVRYDFSPTLYSSGFLMGTKIGGTFIPVLSADLTMTSLYTMGGAGIINPYLNMNLTNITPIAYTYGSGSSILDAFLSGTGGTEIVTLQLAGTNLANAIESGQGFITSYSASAAPVAALVPEPATLLLLGSGLLGLGMLGRKRVKKG